MGRKKARPIETYSSTDSMMDSEREELYKLCDESESFLDFMTLYNTTDWIRNRLATPMCKFFYETRHKTLVGADEARKVTDFVEMGDDDWEAKLAIAKPIRRYYRNKRYRRRDKEPKAEQDDAVQDKAVQDEPKAVTGQGSTGQGSTGRQQDIEVVKKLGELIDEGFAGTSRTRCRIAVGGFKEQAVADDYHRRSHTRRHNRSRSRRHNDSRSRRHTRRHNDSRSRRR
jgi:hypothetical protein